MRTAAKPQKVFGGEFLVRTAASDAVGLGTRRDKQKTPSSKQKEKASTIKMDAIQINNLVCFLINSSSFESTV